MASVVANVESSSVAAGNLAAETSQPVALHAGSAHAHIGALHGLAGSTAGHHFQFTLVGSTAGLCKELHSSKVEHGEGMGPRSIMQAA